MYKVAVADVMVTPIDEILSNGIEVLVFGLAVVLIATFLFILLKLNKKNK